MASSYLSFSLSDEFIEEYKDREIPWGFPIGGGNNLGELIFISKYSRKKEDGTKERWHECCRRVIEGMYSILKDHCNINRTPWNEAKAQRSAKDAFERMFVFKWLPPGRGLWMMGTEFVHADRNSAALQNCSFLTTDKLSIHSYNEAILPFARLMEMSMLGIGVGMDTRGAGKLVIHSPREEVFLYEIEDSREGWADSTAKLLASYLLPNQKTVQFDYSLIRPAGEPIKRFGGIAPGPAELIKLHDRLRNLFDGREGEKITSTDIADVANMVGKAVVSGGVRRTAEIIFGDPMDKEFINLKNWEVNPVRMGKDGWGHLSNNSIFTNVGENYDYLIPNIVMNGEPGFSYLNLSREYGRLVDPPNFKDKKVMGSNPCMEQNLEPWELCCLVETFPYRNDNLDDYINTLKVAYLYGKAVTLLPTPWPESNEVMQRNRRIGCSMSGVVQFAEAYGWTELRTWMNTGYKFIQDRDKLYSEWLGVRESIKTTSIKPSGTVSLLAGATPGVHWPTANFYIRRMRFNKLDPLIEIFKKAGYKTEPSYSDPDSDVVIEFPTRGPNVRTEREVTVWEKASLAILAQRYWADNSVSVTLTFQPHEAEQIEALLRAFDGQLKALSFLPIGEEGKYEQMPYETTPENSILELSSKIQPVDWNALYDGESLDAQGESGCTNDYCEVKY
jgi:ribonucleoside-triphosphate reductase